MASACAAVMFSMNLCFRPFAEVRLRVLDNGS
jgi:hypothetical protein